MADFIGIDIGTATLKAVQITEGKLAAFAQFPAPPGATIYSDDKEALKSLSGALGQLLREGRFVSRNVVSALPESQVFTQVVAFPKMSPKEIASVVQNEAQQYVPLSLAEATLDYEILGASEDNPNEMDVLLVAAPRALSQRFVKVFRQSKLNILSLETESTALYRSVIGSVGGSAVGILSIGAKTTDLSIFAQNTLRFTRSIPTGGEALTRALAQSLGMELEHAQEYFRSYGLLEDPRTGGKVVEAIKPLFGIINDEVKKSLDFYSSRHKQAVRRVVLVGGVANLPGIVVYLAQELGVEVARGSPWEGINIPREFSRKKLDSIAPSFAVAVGLALKEL
jgi:type IV pilus assembly protein PilM